MNRRVGVAIVVLVLLVVAAVVAGGFGYRIGMMQGLAANPQLTAPSANGGAVPYMLYGAPFMYGRPFGWGFGFGFLQCLFPLLGLFLIFALIRGLFWGGWRRRGWGGHGWGPGFGPGGQDVGPEGQGVPPMFAEWHKRSHTTPGTEGQGQPPATSNQ